MRDASLTLLDSCLHAAVEGLFRSHGTEALLRGPGHPESRGEIVVTIGFTSEPMRGALLLALSRATARATLPANLRGLEPSDEILADWAGELSNQLLGRLKNGLSEYGLLIALGTPVAFVGRDMLHFSPSPDLRRSFAYGLLSGDTFVEFEADHDSGLELVMRVKEEAGLSDGEFQLF